MTEVPLAETGGGVALLFADFGERLFFVGQSVAGARTERAVDADLRADVGGLAEVVLDDGGELDAAGELLVARDADALL